MFIIGFIFITILGTFAHFAYELSHEKRIVGLICAVNESVWEHMKMVVLPSIIWMFISLIIYKNSSVFTASFIGLITTLILIPVLFYFNLYVTKKDSLFIHIVEFVVAIFIGMYSYEYVLNNYEPNTFVNIVFLINIFLIQFLFMYKTNHPYHNFLFKDSRNNKYGLDAYMKPL